MQTKEYIDDTLFHALQSFIEETTGIYIPPTRKYLLEDRLRPVLRRNNIATFSEYLSLLEKTQFSSKQGLLDEFKDLVSTHETSFFRHQTQMNQFENNILLEYMSSIQSRSDKTITVWSAGCSTGEETYSIAMSMYTILHTKYSSWKIQILGTDISSHVIEKAQQGIYSDYAIRNMPAIYRQYFTIQGSVCSIIPPIRSLVEFSVLNLKDAFAIRKLPTCDMIFCRNVHNLNLIHISEPTP
ncbi:MAG: hypothetical protein K2M30_01985, partial [Desulfovibrionaceae bacterium]|nr:hypothetical protein [Desulfovibrionaceae bacterium]